MKTWTDEETEFIRSNLDMPVLEMAQSLPGRSASSIDHKVRKLRQEQRSQVKRDVAEAAMNPPIEVDMASKVRELESTLALMSQQITWAQHAESPNRTGGVLTLRASDHHYGDLNHLMSCGMCLEEKAIEVFKQYQPDRINIVAGDDWIAGKGIFRTQDREVVTTDTNEQCAIGGMHARRWLLKVREQGIATPITWHVMRGNHDYNDGISMTEYLFLLLKNVTSDIPNVRFVMHWDRNILNLADEGTYNVLIRHGTGHSNLSPNSASFISAVKDEIIDLIEELHGNQRIRRVISGHSHWADIGTARGIDLMFDTTGGLQRNTRVKLGCNQRPIGWIAYVSPKGMKDNILAPILISPDLKVYRRESNSPHLANDNRENAAKRLREYRELMEQWGEFAKNEHNGIQEGRW